MTYVNPEIGIVSDGRVKHKQTKVLMDGELVEVDDGVSRLVNALWQQPIRPFKTQFSCQGDPYVNAMLSSFGRAYVLFYDAYHAYCFMRVLATKLDDLQALMSVQMNMMSDGRASVTWPPKLTDEITRIFEERKK